MSEVVQVTAGPERLPTGVTGLDTVLGGGLPTRRTCLIAGAPGSGKTTLGNQIAFAHAAAGGQVVVASLLAETHDTLFGNLGGFGFFDRALIGDRIQYLSILNPLIEGGLDATIDQVSREVRRSGASLLLIDGTAVLGDFAASTFDLRRFIQRLESQFSLLGCTTLLLTSAVGDDLHLLSSQVNGSILLRNDLVGSRHVRTLEISKMRGVRHAGGTHEFAILPRGIAVFPRLESIVGTQRPPDRARHGIGTGTSTLDLMLGGGLKPLSSTLLLGTPGIGKTILGLGFLAEGARRGEQGLMVSFHETSDDLTSTAAGVGMELGEHVASGLVRVLWHPPLELSADGWAWEVLDAVDAHRPVRIFIDGLTDIERSMTEQHRISAFIPALVNELRVRGVTSIVSAEIESYTDDVLTMPVPVASATLDNSILLRHVEMGGRLRRLVSVLKVRQANSDPAIREMDITDQGMVISRPFAVPSGLLTGRADPEPDADDPQDGSNRP